MTLARCLAARPKLMLVDELSLGLAPIVVESLLDALHEAATRTGAAVLIVEQQVQRALSVASRWYLLRQGSLAGTGDADAGAAGKLSTAYL